MAQTIIWTHEANEDLASIAHYIARDSAFYAAAFVQKVKTASQTLKNFPAQGRVVPEISDPNIRELLIGDYRLMYRVDSFKVVILALLHGARNFKN